MVCGAASLVKLIYWLIELNERQEIIIGNFDDVINWLGNYIWFSEVCVVHALCNVNLLNKTNFILESTWLDWYACVCEYVVLSRAVWIRIDFDNARCHVIHFIASKCIMQKQGVSWASKFFCSWFWLRMIELWELLDYRSFQLHSIKSIISLIQVVCFILCLVAF